MRYWGGLCGFTLVSADYKVREISCGFTIVADDCAVGVDFVDLRLYQPTTKLDKLLVDLRLSWQIIQFEWIGFTIVSADHKFKEICWIYACSRRLPNRREFCGFTIASADYFAKARFFGLTIVSSAPLCRDTGRIVIFCIESARLIAHKWFRKIFPVTSA